MVTEHKNDYLKVLSLVKNSKNPTIQKTLQALTEVNNQIDIMKRNGMKEASIWQFRQDAISSIKLDCLEASRIESEQLQNKLNILKDAYNHEYQKNYSNNSRIIDDARRHYSAMDKTELEAEANAIISNPATDMLPGQLEELSIALKDSGSEVFPELRQTINSNNLLKPWINSDLGKSIVDELNIVANGNMILKDEDNSNIAFDFDSIKEIMDAEARAVAE